MGSPVFELFRAAIVAKRQIVCSYNGYPRALCPHMLGYGKTGDEMALTYQFAGTSSKGLPPGGAWRCFELARVRDAQTVDGEWHTGAFRLQQTCVATVVAEVAVQAAL